MNVASSDLALDAVAAAEEVSMKSNFRAHRARYELNIGVNTCARATPARPDTAADETV